MGKRLNPSKPSPLDERKLEWTPGATRMELPVGMMTRAGEITAIRELKRPAQRAEGDAPAEAPAETGGFIGEVDITLSSEIVGSQWWGDEILDHGPESVRLDRFKSGGGAIRWMHQRPRTVDDYLGDITNPALADRKLKVTTRFADTVEGRKLWELVRTKQLRNVSVGYWIYRMVLEKEEEGWPTYRVTDWEPCEATYCDVPLDYTVGSGRDVEDGATRMLVIERATPNSPESPGANDTENTMSVEVNQEREKAQKAERERAKGIRALAARFKISADETDKAVNEGEALADFQSRVFDIIAERGDKRIKPINPTANDVGLDEGEARTFSLGRAIRAVLLDSWAGAEFEKEVVEAAETKAREAGVKGHGGLFIPPEVQRARVPVDDAAVVRMLAMRALNTGNAAAGGNLVGTEHMGGAFIDMLKNDSLAYLFNPLELNGLTGKVQIPRKTAAGAVAWIGEDAAAAEDALALGLLDMETHTVSGTQVYTRNLLLNSDPSIDLLVKRDIGEELVLALDKAYFVGTGLNGQPLGILLADGVHVIDDLAVAGVPDYAELMKWIVKTKISNAQKGNLAWVTNPLVEGWLANLKIENGDAARALQDTLGGQRLRGYRFESSNQIPDTHLAFGDFSKGAIGYWGVMELLVNPYAASRKGNVEITGFLSADVVNRTPEAMAVNAEMNVTV